MRSRRPLADDAWAQELLAHLRQRLACPEIGYAEKPRRLLGGSEAGVVAFRLADAPPPFAGRLVLRGFRPGQEAGRAALEAGIHDAARAAGLATPACVLHETNREVLGSAFLLIEWVEGEALLGGLAIEALSSKLRAGSVVRTLGGAPGVWNAIVTHTADAAQQIARVDAGDVEAAIRARGVSPEFLSLDARLARIRRRVAKVGLDRPLAPALEWLDANRPPTPLRPCLVHGDLAPANLLVRDGQLAGVLDWSKALLAEPEAEVGFQRVSLRTAAIAGLGPWNRVCRWLFATLAERITERYAAARALDPERLRWYEAMRAVSLLASNVKRRKPKRRRPHVLDARGSAAAIARELERSTGVRLSMDWQRIGPGPPDGIPATPSPLNATARPGESSSPAGLG